MKSGAFFPKKILFFGGALGLGLGLGPGPASPALSFTLELL